MGRATTPRNCKWQPANGPSAARHGWQWPGTLRVRLDCCGHAPGPRAGCGRGRANCTSGISSPPFISRTTGATPPPWRMCLKASKALIGRPIGAGIWFNYALLVVWIIDAAWLWFGDQSYFRRSKALSYAIHGFIFFMVINGAIVFAPDYVRWPSIAACGLLVWAWFTSPARARR